MLNLSNAFRRALYNDERDYLTWADITLANGVELNLTNVEIWSSGFGVDDAVSEDGSFTALGSAIIGSGTLVINNIDDAFSEYDFMNAEVLMYIGKDLIEDGTERTDRLKKGRFHVDKASYNGGTITLTLLDNMEQFDRPYSLSNLTYPATLDEIVRNACQVCGVSLGTYDFPHKDYTVQNRPPDDSTSFRDVISWSAAIAGCFARCNTDGKLELKWFDTANLENIWNGLDGGRFDSAKPYATGDAANGGVFNPWNDGDAVDGGLFENRIPYHNISALYSQNIDMDDVVVTGVQVTVKDEDAENSQTALRTYTVGQKGYMIGIENNPFITVETANTVVTWLGTQLIGLRFRGLSVTHASDPSIEAGDIGIVWDRKNNGYATLITRTNFSASGQQTTVCGTETPGRNSATRFSQQTKTYVESRKMLKKEISEREKKLQELSEKLEAHSGLYSTIEETTGGGSIYYLHDMPRLTESSIIWKMTTEAWGVSTNGGKTWNGGMTVDGDVIARILSAVGVDADWITTGTISSKDGSVSIDLDKNLINIKGVTDFSAFETKNNLKTAGKTTINGSNITTGSIKDANSNTVFNLSDGTLTIKKGSINIGNGNFAVDTSGNVTIKKGSINLGSGNFVVDSSGNVTIKSGSINIGNGNFKVTSGGYLSANSVDLKGAFRSVSGNTFTEISSGRFKAGYTSGNYDTLHGYIDASFEYLGTPNSVQVMACTGLLVLGARGTTYFTDESGTGIAWAWVNSNGLHSKGGLTVPSIAIPTGFDSEGKATGWYTGSIDSGIIR